MAFMPEKKHGRTFKYQYNQMDSTCKKIYKAIFDAVVEYQPSLFLPGIYNSDIVVQIFFKMLYDNPSIFWVKNNILYWDKPQGTGLEFTYTYTPDEVHILKRKISAEVNRIWDVCMANAKNYLEMELLVHDYLTRNVKYAKTDPVVHHTMVGPLVYHIGACSGISEAFSYIMGVFGIKSTIIHGKLFKETEGHAWNVVFLEDGPYHVDVTHDLECSTYPYNHQYFNVTDDFMNLDRTWDPQLFRCTKKTNGYYSQRGAVFKNTLQVQKYVMERVALKEGIIEFEISPDPGEIVLSNAILTALVSKYPKPKIKIGHTFNHYHVTIASLRSILPSI